MKSLDEPFWSIFLSIAIIGTITWLAIFEHNYHPRIHRYSNEVTILQVGNSELDFNHPEGAFSIWWQNEGKDVRLWPRHQAFHGDRNHLGLPSMGFLSA